MFNIPDTYKIGSNGKRLNLKTFTSADLNAGDKKRLRETLKRVTLTDQISGESIPSLINEEYNCAVIMFLDIQLEDMKHVAFVGRVIQNLIKPYCVISFSDHKQQALCFAHKRLSKTDDSEIVVEELVVTKSHPLTGGTFPPPALDFEALKNRANKRDLYLEAMTKAYLCDNDRIFMKARALFDSKVWFNGTQTLNLLRDLKTLESLKTDKSRAVMAQDKVVLNKQIKEQINLLKKSYIGA